MSETVILIGVSDSDHSRSLQLKRYLKSNATDFLEVGWGRNSGVGINLLTRKSSFLKALPSLVVDVFRFNLYLLLARNARTVILAHPCQLNLAVVYPLAFLLRKYVVVDFYTSLHDTLVMDRGLVREKSGLSWILKVVDRLTLRLANAIIFDSRSNQERFMRNSGYEFKKSTVLYPSPPASFQISPRVSSGEKRDVIFVGKFSPLQGLEHILTAATLPKLSEVSFTIVGSGQRPELVREYWDKQNIKFIAWVDYQKLAAEIRNHSISLGVFGESEKAGSVFPNKVMESLRSGVPCITRDGEISENFSDIGCEFVTAGDPDQIANKILDLVSNPDKLRELSNQAAAFSTGIGSDAEQCRKFAKVLPDMIFNCR